MKNSKITIFVSSFFNDYIDRKILIYLFASSIPFHFRRYLQTVFYLQIRKLTIYLTKLYSIVKVKAKHNWLKFGLK